MNTELENKIAETLNVASEHVEPANDAWAQIMGRADHRTARAARFKKWSLVLAPTLVGVVVVGAIGALATSGTTASKNSRVQSANAPTQSAAAAPLPGQISAPQLNLSALPGGSQAWAAAESRLEIICTAAVQDGCGAYGGWSLQEFRSVDPSSDRSVRAEVAFGVPDKLVTVAGKSAVMNVREVSVQGHPATLGTQSSGDRVHILSWVDGDAGVSLTTQNLSEDQVFAIADAFRPTALDGRAAGYITEPLKANQVPASPVVKLDGSQVCVAFTGWLGAPNCGPVGTLLVGPALNVDTGGQFELIIVGAVPKTVTAAEVTGPNGEVFTTKVAPAPVGDFNVVTARSMGTSADSTARPYTMVARGASGQVVDTVTASVAFG